MRGMMGTQGISVGMLGIRVGIMVGTQGIRVGIWKIRVVMQ